MVRTVGIFVHQPDLDLALHERVDHLALSRVETVNFSGPSVGGDPSGIETHPHPRSTHSRRSRSKQLVQVEEYICAQLNDPGNLLRTEKLHGRRSFGITEAYEYAKVVNWGFFRDG